jgi:LPXTG-motif cell wall-anchored protein
VSADSDDSGSPLGLLVGVMVAAALTAAGVVMARRRRPPEEGLA